MEGIYETQVPLMFRALTNLGCLCQVSAERRKALRGRVNIKRLHLLQFCNFVSLFSGNGCIFTRRFGVSLFESGSLFRRERHSQTLPLPLSTVRLFTSLQLLLGKLPRGRQQRQVDEYDRFGEERHCLWL